MLDFSTLMVDPGFLFPVIDNACLSLAGEEGSISETPVFLIEFINVILFIFYLK
jgi:hypothetical protein